MKKTTKAYTGPERRKFVRLDFITPLAYKVCKRKTIKKILEGYTSDISTSGISCSIDYRVNKDDILWLSFDRSTLSICRDLENHSFIYQNGVIGKVVRVKRLKGNKFTVGIQFMTREEKDKSYIMPDTFFGRMAPSEIEGEEIIRDESGEEELPEETEEAEDATEESRENEDEEL